jgi:pimeloyl-ACP methyl ester carboxylesterase
MAEAPPGDRISLTLRHREAGDGQVEGVGHVAPLEAPAAVNRALAEFMGGLPDVPGRLPRNDRA